MKKAEILQKLGISDPYIGFVAKENPQAWGINSHREIFASFITQVRPKTIIEVGSWFGASAVHMAQISKQLGLDTGIICVDTWLGSLEHWRSTSEHWQLGLKNGLPDIYSSFMSNVVRTGLADTIVPLPLPSLIAAKLLKEKGVTAELIYIDASHDELDVYNDLCAYWELVEVGGGMFGDDWNWRSVMHAVVRFCGERDLVYQNDEINWTIQKRPEVETNFSPAPQDASSLPGQGYAEPEMAYLILDYRRPELLEKCLRSLEEHTKFPYKVIYLHNGGDISYPYELFNAGRIDHFIQTKKNNGLGIGTRDLFAASFSPYSFYLQNDQYLNRDFTQEEFNMVKAMLDAQFASPEDGSVWTAKSIDLAGGVCGLHQYSERGHITKTAFYKEMEAKLPLSFYGAGPYHSGIWREEQIRTFYSLNKFIHYTYEARLVENSGDISLRENPDGSRWEQKPLSLGLRLVSGPVTRKNIFPRLTDLEWERVIETQSWPEWQVPEQQRQESIPE